MKRFIGLCILVCVLGVVMSATVFAQGAKFSVDFNKTPLSQVLEALKRFDPTLQFSLPQDYADVKITASLVDVTVDQALQMVLDQANLMSIKDNGVYQIREKPEAHVERGDRPPTQLPALPVWQIRAASPTEATDTGAAAGASGGAPTTVVGAAGAPGTAAGGVIDPKKLPWHLMFTRYMDPADLAGTIVQGNSGLQNQSGGSGGSGGNSQGGYSNNSNNSSNGSSNNSSSSGNRGSSNTSSSSSGRTGY